MARANAENPHTAPRVRTGPELAALYSLTEKMPPHPPVPPKIVGKTP